MDRRRAVGHSGHPLLRRHRSGPRRGAPAACGPNLWGTRQRSSVRFYSGALWHILADAMTPMGVPALANHLFAVLHLVDVAFLADVLVILVVDLAFQRFEFFRVSTFIGTGYRITIVILVYNVGISRVYKMQHEHENKYLKYTHFFLPYKKQSIVPLAIISIRDESVSI